MKNKKQQQNKKEKVISHEYKMYKLLVSIICNLNHNKTEKKYSLFAQVRLADIITLWEEKYWGNGSFTESTEKNTAKRSICEMIQENKHDFSNDDYKMAFLYPLLNSHIDFLICINDETQSIPVLAIELYGKEHDEKSEKADMKRIRNDKFKKALFEASSVHISFLTVMNNELNNKEVRAKILETLNSLSISTN